MGQYGLPIIAIMLKSNFSLSSVREDELEFRRLLETRSPQGERVIDHMARTGITLADEREAFEKTRHLQQARRGLRNARPDAVPR